MQLRMNKLQGPLLNKALVVKFRESRGYGVIRLRGHILIRALARSYRVIKLRGYILIRALVCSYGVIKLCGQLLIGALVVYLR